MKCSRVAISTMVLLLLGFGLGRAQGPTGAPIDLSYPFNEETVYWPTASPFELTVEAAGQTEAGYWYAANSFRAAEHGGTHLDAPIHFAEGKRTAAEIPLDDLMGPGGAVGPIDRATWAQRSSVQVRWLISTFQAWVPMRPHGWSKSVGCGR